MTASSQLPAPNLMPLMRYRDLAEAMGWLEQAFGFEKQIAVADSDGAAIYGQMTYRGGLIMMGAVRDTDLDKLMRQPDEVGGVETQSCYLVVDDADQHYARALEAGADIVLELKSDGLGRRGYSCRDPEGHIWSFGTYNPGRGLTMTVAPAALPVAEDPPAAAPPRRGSGFLMSAVALLVVAGAVGWMLTSGADRLIASRTAESTTHISRVEADRAYAELVKVRAEKRLADERLAALSRDLETERARAASAAAATPSAMPDTAAADAALAQEKSAREAAEKALASLREELKREQEARDAAVEAKRVIEEKLAALAASPESKTAPPASAMPPGAQSDATPAPSVAGPVAGDTNGIETSATNAAAPPAGASRSTIDKDAESAAETESRVKSAETRRERSSRAAQRTRRAEVQQPVVGKRYPAYVTDVKQVWPYALWSN